MAKPETRTRQEDVLRLLDTRLACLMVDRRESRNLRPALFQLRNKLARENLDNATLTNVERTVTDLLPRGSAGASSAPSETPASSGTSLRVVQRKP